MGRTQYKKAKELSTQERLKLVARLHLQGKSHFAIARELEYSVAQARVDVATVSHATREWEDLGDYLKDVVARTGDLLQTLKRKQDILEKQLDWANEWVPQLDALGIPLRERTSDGELGEIMYGPRDSRLCIALSGQISALTKEQGTLLGVYAKTMDVTVKLEESEKINILILETLQELAPEIQSKLVRKLKALQSAQNKFSNIEVETIEGEYQLEEKRFLNA